MDKASKLLAISSEKDTADVQNSTITADEILTAPGEQDTITEPAAKKIKIEQLEENQVVWATSSGTRIQLHSEDKVMIEENSKLNDKHINFAQALLRAQFPWCERLQNTLL